MDDIIAAMNRYSLKGVLPFSLGLPRANELFRGWYVLAKSEFLLISHAGVPASTF